MVSTSIRLRNIAMEIALLLGSEPLRHPVQLLDQAGLVGLQLLALHQQPRSWCNRLISTAISGESYHRDTLSAIPKRGLTQ